MGNEVDPLLDKIEQRLFKLRDPEEGNRRGTCSELLYYLNYTKTLSMSQYDAFLIKAVNQVFAEFTPDADIVLMTLGLLDGYNYRVILRHTDRRIKFLKESPYLGSKKSSYDEADKSRRGSYEKTIRECENQKLHLLAKYLESIQGQVKEFLDDIDNYIDGRKAILPTPSYIEGKPLQDRIKQAVITFSISNKKLFTTKNNIVINKNNEYEMTVDLPTDVSLHKKGKISTLAIFIFVLLFASLSIHTLSYTHKDMLVKTQETDMEYQTKNDIIKNDERFNQKLNAKSTAGSFSENNYSVASF